MNTNEMLSTIFSKNRAEENPDDLWGKFVLPLHYKSYNLLSFEKGNRIIGGRGSGKTTYLKYHCYQTQLSTSRQNIKHEDLHKVGIYWRPDNNFTQVINQNYLGEKWKSIFDTYLSLSLLKELSEFIKYFINSNFPDEDTKQKLKTALLPPAFAELLNYKGDDLTYLKLSSVCHSLLKIKLAVWLNMPYSEQPIILPGKAILEYIIDHLKEQGFFVDSTFHIFIDEFENLRFEQQSIINTWMKHGKAPLLFSVAYKKFSNISDNTIGQEKLQNRDDYRIIDIIEDVYAKEDKSFKVLAAEIIALKLQTYLSLEGKLIDDIAVSSFDDIDTRLTTKYQNHILSLVKTIFPGKSYDEIAKDILEDDILHKRLITNISQALKEKVSSINANYFVNVSEPSASVTNASLLFRKGTDPDNLLTKFQNALQGDTDPSYKEQIGNTLVGSILHIYSSYSTRICPIYAGFDAFANMARNNLRHFLELCHQSFIELEIEQKNAINKDILPIIPVHLQSKAAKTCSIIELERISELGEYGQSLQRVAYRLGKIFELKQSVKSQSEPEAIHFSIKKQSIQELGEEIVLLIQQAELWNILLSYDATKNKSIHDISTKEWMLTPMLAPYFNISHRKIRKLEFTEDEIKIIFIKNDDEFEVFFKELTRKWISKTIESKSEQSLFGEGL